jgi:PST family polysaccharide transporter
LGFQKAIVQTAELVPQQLHSAFWLSLALSGLLYFSIWATGPILSAAFREPELQSVIRWLGLLVVLKSLTVVHRGLLVRRFQFKLLALRSIASIAIGGAVGIGMAMQGYTVWALVGQQLASAVASTLALWFSATWMPEFRFSWSAVKTMLPFSLTVTGSNLLDVANKQTDKLLIGAYLGKTELGAYTIAYKVFGVASEVILRPLSRIALPTFSQLQDDLPKLRSAYYTAVCVSSAVSLPIFLLIMLSVDRLIPALFGVQWVESVPVLQLLMVSSCVHSINSFSSPLLLALGRARTVFRLNIINVTLNIIGLLIAIRWGVVAVALAFALRSILMFPADFYFLHRYADISYKHLLSRMKGHLAGLLAIVLTILASNKYLYELSDWTVMSFQYLASATAYLLVLFILDRALCLRISDFLLIVVRRG